MRTPLLTVCFLFAHVIASATAQHPDLLFDGGKQPMHCNPLEAYFEQFPQKRPQTEVISSGLWRGYVAHFEIRQSELWVKDVQIQTWDRSSENHDTKWLSVLKQVFPDASQRRVSWYTGFLILPRGKMTHYVHMGYASTFEKYKLIFLREGRILASRVFSEEEYIEYKQLQFEAFSKSERFRKMSQDLDQKYGRDGTITAENFLFIFDVTFPSEVLIDYKDFKPNK